MSALTKVKYPISIKWKLTEARLLKKKDAGYFKSAAFDIPGTDIKYYLRIFPNGSNEERRGMACIDFYLSYKLKKKIETELSFCIDTANFIKTEKPVYKRSGGYGVSISTVEELYDHEKCFIVGGEMEITIEGYLFFEIEVPSIQCQLASSQNELSLILWNQQKTDCIIVAEGKEIHAHKSVLFARSAVLEALFQDAQNNHVTIPDFSFDVVDKAIKFCYHSSLVENLTLEDQISLLQFFDNHDIDSLKANLEMHLILQVDIFNVCALANCSILAKAPKLRQNCAKFLEVCSRTRKPVIDFDTLNMDFAIQLFKSNLCCVSL